MLRAVFFFAGSLRGVSAYARGLFFFFILCTVFFWEGMKSSASEAGVGCKFWNCVPKLAVWLAVAGQIAKPETCGMLTQF